MKKNLNILEKRHKEAAEAVMNTLKYKLPADGMLGVVAMPSGTGKNSCNGRNYT